MEAAPSGRFFVPAFKYYGVGFQIVLGWESALPFLPPLAPSPLPFSFFGGRKESSKGATLWPKTEKALFGLRLSVAVRVFSFLTHLPFLSPLFPTHSYFLLTL